jgi:peptidoglycan hydrolase CwlO-like protein
VGKHDVDSQVFKNIRILDRFCFIRGGCRELVGKLGKWVLVIGLMIGSFQVIAPQVLANSINDQIKDAQEKQQNIKGQRSNIKQDLNNKQQTIEELKEEQKQLNGDIKSLDMKVSDTIASIQNKQKEIEKTEAEIEQLNEEIKELEVRIEKRDELLKNRARSVQHNGGVINYVDVLLGAKSFGDFLDRVGAVSVIVQQDREILDKHIEEKEMVEQKREDVTAMLETFEEQKRDLEGLRSQLEAQRVEKEKLMEQLKEREDHIEDEMIAIEEEDAILASQERVTAQLIKQLKEQKRQSELAGDGKFMRPAAGPVTSNYGQRWGDLHAGIDIGKRGDNVPVVAVQSGIVFRSYYSSTYGNVVFITHSVDGQIYTSVYAHMDNREVSEGDTVKKGQRLGYMGNTGRSFGAHLHFELHKGQWNLQKTNSVDPRKYISF